VHAARPAQFKYADKPLPLDEVEPAKEIVKRFTTGAMSYGSISKEAHETLAIAMNRLGGMSNTGEGGEDEERFKPDANGDSRRSAVKQVASGRFGVTTNYLVNADEFQIKMAQGAKPGEGGQLPGHKVDEIIAKTRHSIPGVGLISPPPHHDIYSIEDLAQLIYDLKNVNPQARIAVKLVSEVGVGTVAAGVSQGACRCGADLRRQRRHRRFAAQLHQARRAALGAGPGRDAAGAAAQRSAQPHQGADRRQAADRARRGDRRAAGRRGVRLCHHAADHHGLHHDAQVPSEHLLGGHRHAGPGVARALPGQPEHVVNFFFFIAEQMRQYMAKLGFRTVDEMVGRVDKIDAAIADEHWKAKGIDLSSILYAPTLPSRVARRKVQAQDHGLDAGARSRADRRPRRRSNRRRRSPAASPSATCIAPWAPCWAARSPALRLGRIARRNHPLQIQRLGRPELRRLRSQRRHAGTGRRRQRLPGQGLSGGRIIVYPPKTSSFLPEESILVGNVVLYGATTGEVFLNGIAGERFAVRNSGATAVVEGVGDHGCEYMTNGTVVVLGSTGRNFAAGMNGGRAFVYDDQGDFSTRRCNTAGVDLEPLVLEEDVAEVRGLLERHRDLTGSPRAAWILEHWAEAQPRFIKVFPHEYKRVLGIPRVETVYSSPTTSSPLVAARAEVQHG
jgi:glutamate synthase (NADPH/NADH) large chain